VTYVLIGSGVAMLVALVAIVVGMLGQRRVMARDWISPGMYGVVGRMGGGKTYLMAHAAHLARAAGRPVYANFGLEGAEPLRSWDDVLAVPRGSMVLVDEVHLWWPSRAYQAPPQLEAWCSQVRKLDVTFLWSSQDWSFVSKRLRHLTFGAWKARRIKGTSHTYAMYEGSSVERVRAEPVSKLVLRRLPEVEASYDTLEVVEASCAWDPADRTRGTRVGRTPPLRVVPDSSNQSGGLMSK